MRAICRIWMQLGMSRPVNSLQCHSGLSVYKRSTRPQHASTNNASVRCTPRHHHLSRGLDRIAKMIAKNENDANASFKYPLGGAIYNVYAFCIFLCHDKQKAVQIWCNPASISTRDIASCPCSPYQRSDHHGMIRDLHYKDC